MASPADGCQPRSRCPDRRPLGWDSHGNPPAGEPARRRPRVDAVAAGQVLPPVLQHVQQSVTHLAWCPEHTSVMPVGPDSSAAADDPIYRLRDANAETLQPTPKPAGTVGLDEQVHMVRLHAEMQQTEPGRSRPWRTRLGSLRTRCRAEVTANRAERGASRGPDSADHAPGRRSCGTHRRPGMGFRPAPSRLPPHVRGRSSSCRPCRILNPAHIITCLHVKSCRGPHAIPRRLRKSLACSATCSARSAFPVLSST